jgi:hypothetical protein
MNLMAADLAAAGKMAAWARTTPPLLAVECADMAAHFPAWLLTVGDGEGLTACAQCGEMLVFGEGKLACQGCGRAGKGRQLAWTGHLPMPVGGLPHALARIRKRAHPGFPLIEAARTLLWLVPVLAVYPSDWPRSAPSIQYDPELFNILGIRTPGATHHMVGRALCLYAGGQWRSVTMRVVLQQRVVNHLASILKVGDGMTPVLAFAGKQHTYDQDWGDYR